MKMDSNCFVEENINLNVIDSVLKTMRKLENKKAICCLVKKILVENNHEENQVNLIRVGHMSKDKEELLSQQIYCFESQVYKANLYA